MLQNLRCHLKNEIKDMAEDTKKTGKWLHDVDEANDNEQTQQGDWLDNSQEATDDKQDSQK